MKGCEEPGPEPSEETPYLCRDRGTAVENTDRGNDCEIAPNGGFEGPIW